MSNKTDEPQEWDSEEIAERLANDSYFWSEFLELTANYIDDMGMAENAFATPDAKAEVIGEMRKGAKERLQQIGGDD